MDFFRQSHRCSLILALKNRLCFKKKEAKKKCGAARRISTTAPQHSAACFALGARTRRNGYEPRALTMYCRKNHRSYSFSASSEGARNAPSRTMPPPCAQSSITPLRCSYRPRSKLRKPFRHASYTALSPVVKAPQSGISPCKCRGISFSSPYGARTHRFICRLTASNPAAQAAAEPHRSDPPYRLQPYTLSGSFFTSVLPYDLPGCHAPGCLRARPIRYTRGLGPYAAQPAAAPLMHISPPYPHSEGMEKVC